MGSEEPESKDAEAPFDLTRLRPEERELWDEYCADDWKDAPVLAVWSFGYICVLEAWGPPPVVVEYLEENDHDNLIRRYLESVRRARDEGRP